MVWLVGGAVLLRPLESARAKVWRTLPPVGASRPGRRSRSLRTNGRQPLRDSGLRRWLNGPTWGRPRPSRSDEKGPAAGHGGATKAAGPNAVAIHSRGSPPPRRRFTWNPAPSRPAVRPGSA